MPMAEAGRLRGGTLFSGIGAPELAMGWVDWRWCAEIDPFACAVLRHHYPDTPNLGDVTEVDWDAVEPVDLVVGGPPCQGFSVAGNRGGLSDPRGNLSLAYVRALDAIDPAWSLTENVPGWLSMADNSFGYFLAAMVGADAPLVPARGQHWTDAVLVSGPRRTAAWIVKDAQFHGVPQRRRRVFVLAVRGSGNWSCAEALFPFQEGVRGHPAPRREAGQNAPTLPSRSTAGGGLGTDFDCDGGLIAGSFEQNSMAGRGTLGWSSGDQPLRPVKPQSDHQFLCFDARQSDVCVYGDRAAPLDTDGYTQAIVTGAAGMVDSMRRFAESVRDDVPDVFAYGGGNQSGPIDVATACNASERWDFESETFVTHSLRADGFDASEDGTGRETPLVIDMGGNKELNGGGLSEGITPPLGTNEAHAILTPNGGRGGIGVRAVAIHQNVRSEVRTSDVAWALGQGGGKPGTGYPAIAFQASQSGMRLGDQHPTLDSNNGSRRHHGALQGMSVRRLTPKECARLQGFPDSYLDITWRGRPAADGNKYKALGNSMCVPVVSWLGKRIQVVEETIRSPASEEAAA